MGARTVTEGRPFGGGMGFSRRGPVEGLAEGLVGAVVRPG